MKRLLFAFTCMLFACLFNQSIGQDKKLPYTATYSSNFSLGKAEYATKVLEIWKDWDDNQLSRHDYFADTISMFMPDGSVIRGKANCVNEGTKFRSGFTTVKSTIHAWIPLHSNDTNEDVVCIWGIEEDTSADGKTETKELHEVWWFNKDGKVGAMRQWNAKFGRPQ